MREPNRRRRLVAEPLRKASYQMRASVIEGVKRAVEAGAAPSANVFVEQAVEQRLRELRRARVYRAYVDAARDPEFMRDMDETTQAFDVTLGDGLPGPD